MTGPGHAISVQLLGAFEVRRDDIPIRLGGRPAILLAVLALRLGAAVPYAVLAETLWADDEPPVDTLRTLRTYASRLRDALGREVLVSRGDSLRLELPRDHIDLYRFRDLVAARPEEPGEPEDELERLTEALALWRGTPLTGLPTDLLDRTEGPAVLEELLGATERANELRLRLGRVDQAFLGALRRLVAEHPWRERSWAHLMLALYRDGRQGEALTEYQHLVAVLREDLGISPGEAAAGLHQQILAGDPALLSRDPTTTAPPATRLWPTPAQLPPAPRSFVGRKPQLAELERYLTGPAQRSRVAVVSGPPGMGKTATVVEATHRARPEFPDGQLFIHGTSGGAEVPAADLLAGLLRDLDVSPGEVPATVAERAALFRSICAQRRLLLVVDDAFSAEQVERLLPGAGGCAVVVTSRRRLDLGAELNLDLGVLPPDEAHTALAAIAGEQRLSADPEATAAVLRACGGSPLALRIVGGRLAVRPAWPIAELAHELGGTGQLAGMSLDRRSVRAVLATTVEGLGPDRSGHLRDLAALPLDVTDPDITAAVWQVDATESRRRLEELCDVRLIDPAPDGLYAWHGLIGRYLRDQSGPSTPAAQRRALRQAIRSLRNALSVLRPNDRPEPALPSLDDELDGTPGVRFDRPADVHRWLHPRAELFVALAREGLTEGDGKHAVEAAALTVLFDVVISECCLPADVTETLHRLVVAADLPPEGGHFAAAARHNLAAALSSSGRLSEARALGHEAIAAWRALGDRYGEVAMLNNLANVHRREGDYATAVALLHECVDAGDVLPPSLRARCMVSLATTYAAQGDADAGREWLAAAQKTSRPDPSSVVAADDLACEADVLVLSREFDAALKVAESGVDLARALDSHRLRYLSMTRLARVRRLAGLDSLAAAAEAVRSAFDDNDALAKAEAVIELGHARRAAGDTAGAATCASDAARLLQAAGLAGTPRAQAMLAELAG